MLHSIFADRVFLRNFDDCYLPLLPRQKFSPHAVPEALRAVPYLLSLSTSLKKERERVVMAKIWPEKVECPLLRTVVV